MQRRDKNDVERVTYTPQELAILCGVGLNSIYAGLKDGRIPSFRLTKKYVIPKVAVDNWMKNGGKTAA